MQNFTKPDNWLLSYHQRKRFSNDAVHDLQFLKLSYVVTMTITEFQICSCVPHFTKIRRLFVEMWQFYDFQDGSQLPVMLLVCNDYVQVVYMCVSVTSNII